MKKRLEALVSVRILSVVSLMLFFVAFLAPFKAQAALTDNLNGYWRLDETTTGAASVTRADATGNGNTLNDPTKVGSTPGILNNAASFNGSGQALSIPSNPSLSVGDVDFTVSAWVKFSFLPAVSSVMEVASKLNSGTVRDWSLFAKNNAGTTQFGFYIANSSGTIVGQVTDTGVSIQTGVWYHVLAWHDHAGDEVYIQVNDGTIYNVSTTGMTGASAANFYIGGSGVASTFINGIVDEVGFWKRILTSDERAELYNSGNALAYPFTFAPTVTVQTPSSITKTSATFNGTLVSNGGAPSTAQGFFYGLDTSYALGTTTATSASFATGAFNAAISSLICGTTYHLAAYATNSFGTTTSNDQAFTTNLCVDAVPTVLSSSTPQAVSENSAILNGTIILNGSGDDTAYGFAYGTAPDLSTVIATTTGGTFTGTGDFTSPTARDISGLSTGTTYYYRAYATNPIGTGYGTIQSFITSSATLTNNLNAYWNFNETSTGAASVTRADATGNGNNLSDPTKVESRTSVLDNGVRLIAASNSSGQSFTLPSNPSLSVGDVDFTVSAWVNFSSLPTSANIMRIVSKLNSGTVRDWSLFAKNNSGPTQFGFYINNSSGTIVGQLAATATPIQTNTWYHVVAWRDHTANQIDLQINDGMIYSTTTTGTTGASSANVYVGVDGTGLSYLNGFIDEVGFWKRILTSGERAELYNGGDGIRYPFLNYTPGDSITLTSPVAFEVFQRNNGVGNIPITGTYTGSPTAIEASWNGGLYTTIVSNPTGGTFSATLANQTGGQGTLIVRFANDTTAAAQRGYIGIGDIFIVAGQSNAEGKLTNFQTYSNPTLIPSMFPESDGWQELIDPTDSEAGAGGSVWPLVATLYMADQNVPVAFITVPHDGSGLGSTSPDWQRGNTVYQNAVTTIQNSGVTNVKAILWYQGEHDASISTSQAEYESDLIQLVNNLRTDTNLPNTVKFVIGQIGSGPTTVSAAQFNNIRMAQADLWATDPDILAGPTTYDIDVSVANGGDGTHFKTDAQGQTFADRWWAALQDLFYGGPDGRGPMVGSAYFNGDKTQIILTFTSNELALLPVTRIGGFEVKDDGSDVAINDVSRTSNNQITITLDSPSTGVTTVSLGSGLDGEGIAVPTDSGPYNLPAEPFVDMPVQDLPVVPSIPIPHPQGTSAARQVVNLEALKSSSQTQSAMARNAVSSAASAPSSFSRNLEINESGEDIRSLQMFLNGKGFTVSASGPGSPSNETSFFGQLTLAALKKYQASVGLPSTGYFGPLTRATVAVAK